MFLTFELLIQDEDDKNVMVGLAQKPNNAPVASLENAINQVAVCFSDRTIYKRRDARMPWNNTETKACAEIFENSLVELVLDLELPAQCMASP